MAEHLVKPFIARIDELTTGQKKDLRTALSVSKGHAQGLVHFLWVKNPLYVKEYATYKANVRKQLEREFKYGSKGGLKYQMPVFAFVEKGKESAMQEELESWDLKHPVVLIPTKAGNPTPHYDDIEDLPEFSPDAHTLNELGFSDLEKRNLDGLHKKVFGQFSDKDMKAARSEFFLDHFNMSNYEDMRMRGFIAKEAKKDFILTVQAQKQKLAWTRLSKELRGLGVKHVRVFGETAGWFYPPVDSNILGERQWEVLKEDLAQNPQFNMQPHFHYGCVPGAVSLLNTHSNGEIQATLVPRATVDTTGERVPGGTRFPPSYP
ncbi:MAG: hypothetical protein GOV15_03195 [Candidatus Diapherotrites archaeon]|nr:hypothetical protein [Candidatus Diapherotrites archaeon]